MKNKLTCLGSVRLGDKFVYRSTEMLGYQPTRIPSFEGKCQSKHTIDRFNPQPVRLQRRLTSKFSGGQSSILCPGRFTAN